MNQQQREYLKGRIRTITSAKRDKLNNKHTKKSDIETDRDRWKLVLAGKVSPLKQAKAHFTNNYRCSYKLDELYDFSEYEDKVDRKKLDPAIALLNAKSQEVQDKAMLGDCDEAVRLLAELENF